MSEKRFFVKVYSNSEPFFFDEKQEYVEKRYTCEDVRNLHPMEYWQVVDLLNNLHQENQQLKHYKLYEDNKRLQTIIADLKRREWQLKQELQGMNELLESYRKTIKHDAELLADATRNGYLPPLDDFVKR